MNDSRILDAAKRAGAESIVECVGLNTQIGCEFDGEELLGGEWQKIAIAHGLNKDAEFIILDELTSALDPLVENEILTKFIEMTIEKIAIWYMK